MHLQETRTPFFSTCLDLFSAGPHSGILRLLYGHFSPSSARSRLHQMVRRVLIGLLVGSMGVVELPSSSSGRGERY